MPVIVAGSVSVTVAPVTLFGPALVTTTVYVTIEPGATLVWPSVLVICRSAFGARVSESVAVLLAAFGSVVPAGAATLAVFESVPVAAELIVPLTI